MLKIILKKIKYSKFLNNIMQKNKYWLFLSIIILVSVSINLFWVFNYSNPFNFEDMIQLQSTVILINKDNGEILLDSSLNKISGSNIDFYDFYYSKIQPLIPSLYYVGLKLFWHPFTPLIVNIFFSIILIITTFLISNHIYDKNVAILSSVMVAFSQSLLAHQRTTYDAYILIVLFNINLLFFIKSNHLRNTFWSILWGISSSFCLLARYSQLAYISSILIYFFYFILKNKKINVSQIINISCCILIIMCLVLPHYVHESNINNYINRSKNKNTIFPKNIANIIENFYFYINHIVVFQLGLFYSIIFVISLLKKISLKSLKQYEIFFVLILLQIFSFFSIIPIRNVSVTSLTIPLFIIFVSGSTLLIKNRIVKKIIIAIIILNILLTILPFGIPKTMIFNKNHHIGDSNNLLNYINKDFTSYQIISDLIKNKDFKIIRILDITHRFHNEIRYYSLFIDNDKKIILEDGKDIFKHKKIENISKTLLNYNVILISNLEFNASIYDISSKDKINKLKEMINFIKNSNEFQQFKSYRIKNDPNLKYILVYTRNLEK